MENIIGLLTFTLFLVSIVLIPIYIFAGGDRDSFRTAGVHGGVFGIFVGFFGFFETPAFLLVYVFVANIVMGYLFYFALDYTQLINKRESFQQYSERIFKEIDKKKNNSK